MAGAAATIPPGVISPENMAGQPTGELAPVIPLTPSPDEKGFSFGSFMPLDLRAPLRVLGRTASHIVNTAIPSAVVGEETSVLSFSHQGHNQLLLVTEPSAELDIDPDKTPNKYLRPGLTELGDFGSALRIHKQMVEHYPGERVITEPTPGISHGGMVWTSEETADRRIDEMAADSLSYLKKVTKGGPIQAIGTSLGSVIVVSMTEQNLAANEDDRLDITELTLLSSAVVACNVDPEDDFRPPGIEEEVYRQELSERFLTHVPIDAASMSITNPLAMAECAVALAVAYGLSPQKAAARAKVIEADFRNVKEGVEWSSLKKIVPAMNRILILNGEYCPLAQEQVPQWNKLDELFPGRIQHNLVAGRGHLMSADAKGTVRHLVRMDSQQTAVAA